ncbi:hypothetical protein GI374_09460 [Paracoccus sp. S-4012]|nr:hypothetical protein [Paracoccus sp. S-4012]
MLIAAIAVSSLAAPVIAQEAPDFCRAGFVLADADGDGILGIAEAEALWEQEFGGLDTDASGAVSAEEFAACGPGSLHRNGSSQCFAHWQRRTRRLGCAGGT